MPACRRRVNGIMRVVFLVIGRGAGRFYAEIGVAAMVILERVPIDWGESLWRFYMVVVEALMGACFFAAVVAVLSVPWMNSGEVHAEHH